MRVDVGVVHLVWVPLGLAPFERFLASYQQHAGSQAHHFVVVFNGHKNHEELQPYLKQLLGCPHKIFIIEKPQQDIASYFAAARFLEHQYLCFLNSHSEIIDSAWLQKLTMYVTRPDVGLVGATGSWESGRCGPLNRSDYRTAKGYVYAEIKRRISNRHFGGFPNPHLRTNSFMLSRERMLGLQCRARDRSDALVFEHGKRSMTTQILRLNLKVLVVGRDGRGVESPDWPASLTYRQGEQENLLIADNRTRSYQEGSEKMRRFYAQIAWGENTPAL